MTAAGSDYSMRSYLNSMLYYCRLAKEGWMTQEMYYSDTAGAFDVIDGTPFNEGFDLRQDLTKGSMEFDMLFTPKLEMFNQERLLIPSDVRLKFIRQPPEFYLMKKADDTAEYKIRIKKAELILRTVEMEEPFQRKITRALEEKKVCCYPLISTECTHFLVPYGSSLVSHPISKLGKQPIRIYLTFQDNAIYNGKYDKNPYNFQPHNLSDVNLVINGKQFPTTSLKLQFVKDKDGEIIGGQYLRAYNELQRTTGVLGMNSGFNVVRKDYPKGYFVLGIKTTEAFSDTTLAPSTQGALTINLTFSKPLEVSLSVIMVLEYQKIITVDGNGKVSPDYGS